MNRRSEGTLAHYDASRRWPSHSAEMVAAVSATPRAIGFAGLAAVFKSENRNLVKLILTDGELEDTEPESPSYSAYTISRPLLLRTRISLARALGEPSCEYREVGAHIADNSSLLALATPPGSKPRVKRARKNRGRSAPTRLEGSNPRLAPEVSEVEE